MLAPYTPVGARPLSRPVPCLRLRMQRVQTPKAHPTPLIFAAAKGVVSRSPVPRVPEAVIGVNNKLSAGYDIDDQVTPAVAVTSPTRTSSSAAQPTSSSSYDEKWQARYKELAAYHKKHGHCLVPARFAPHPGLGRWVRYQRALHSEVTHGPATSLLFLPLRPEHASVLPGDWISDELVLVLWLYFTGEAE
jgi:hypothetical protein